MLSNKSLPQFFLKVFFQVLKSAILKNLIFFKNFAKAWAYLTIFFKKPGKLLSQK